MRTIHEKQKRHDREGTAMPEVTQGAASISMEGPGMSSWEWESSSGIIFGYSQNWREQPAHINYC